MRRGAFQWMIGLIVAADALFAVLWTLLLPWPLAFLGPAIAATILLTALFSPRLRVGSVSAPPDQALTALALQLRREGIRVESGPGELTVRTGSASALKLRARATTSGTDILFRAYATPSGWGAIMFLIVLAWTSVLAIPVIAYVWSRSWSFAVRRLPGHLEAVPRSLEALRRDEIAVALLTGLAEGHRLAEEAYESERSVYHDSLAVALFAAFLGWGLVFITVFLSLSDADASRRIGTANLVSVAAGIAAGAASVGLLRRRFRPRLRRLADWNERLQNALAREAHREEAAPSAESAFEVLAEATREVPSWIDASRRAGMSRDPAIGFLVLVMALGTYGLVSAGIGFLGGDPTFAVLLLAAGAGLGFATYAVYARWKRRRDADLAEAQDAWRRRVEDLRARMDRFLQDL